MKKVCLFIDESGDPNPKVIQSPCYIVVGCMVDEDAREKLKIESDQVKFKYWNRTDIVFHSREFSRKENDFKIFTDRSKMQNFQKDLFQLLHNNNFQIFSIVVDKQLATKNNWNYKKVFEETSILIVKNFILSLLAQENIKGRLVIESATGEKDFYFHKAASKFLSRGIPELGITFSQVQNVLTEIAFVTKKNHDVEEQIADLLSYGAKLKFTNKAETSLSAYDKKIKKLLGIKLFKMDPAVGAKKKKYQAHIESFKVIPK